MDKRFAEFKRAADNWISYLSAANKVDHMLDHLHEVYKSGNFAGLYDAVAICQKLALPLPMWAGEATLNTFGAFINPDAPKKRGRHSRWITDYKEDIIDYIRAETVKIHREHYGILSEKVYDAALLTLCIDDPGAAKAESAGAIKKSYSRYVKRSKENPHRYYQSRFMFIKEIHGQSRLNSAHTPDKITARAELEFSSMEKNHNRN